MAAPAVDPTVVTFLTSCRSQDPTVQRQSADTVNQWFALPLHRRKDILLGLTTALGAPEVPLEERRMGAVLLRRLLSPKEGDTGLDRLIPVSPFAAASSLFAALTTDYTATSAEQFSSGFTQFAVQFAQHSLAAPGAALPAALAEQQQQMKAAGASFKSSLGISGAAASSIAALLASELLLCDPGSHAQVTDICSGAHYQRLLQEHQQLQQAVAASGAKGRKGAKAQAEAQAAASELPSQEEAQASAAALTDLVNARGGLGGAQGAQGPWPQLCELFMQVVDHAAALPPLPSLQATLERALAETLGAAAPQHLSASLFGDGRDISGGGAADPDDGATQFSNLATATVEEKQAFLETAYHFPLIAVAKALKIIAEDLAPQIVAHPAAHALREGLFAVLVRIVDGPSRVARCHAIAAAEHFYLALATASNWTSVAPLAMTLAPKISAHFLQALSGLVLDTEAVELVAAAAACASKIDAKRRALQELLPIANTPRTTAAVLATGVELQRLVALFRGMAPDLAAAVVARPLGIVAASKEQWEELSVACAAVTAMCNVVSTSTTARAEVDSNDAAVAQQIEAARQTVGQELQRAFVAVCATTCLTCRLGRLPPLLWDAGRLSSLSTFISAATAQGVEAAVPTVVDFQQLLGSACGVQVQGDAPFTLAFSDGQPRAMDAQTHAACGQLLASADALLQAPLVAALARFGADATEVGAVEYGDNVPLEHLTAAPLTSTASLAGCGTAQEAKRAKKARVVSLKQKLLDSARGKFTKRALALANEFVQDENEDLIMYEEEEAHADAVREGRAAPGSAGSGTQDARALAKSLVKFTGSSMVEQLDQMALARLASAKFGPPTGVPVAGAMEADLTGVAGLGLSGQVASELNAVCRAAYLAPAAVSAVAAASVAGAANVPSDVSAAVPALAELFPMVQGQPQEKALAVARAAQAVVAPLVANPAEALGVSSMRAAFAAAMSATTASGAALAPPQPSSLGVSLRAAFFVAIVFDACRPRPADVQDLATDRDGGCQENNATTPDDANCVRFSARNAFGAGKEGGGGDEAADENEEEDKEKKHGPMADSDAEDDHDVDEDEDDGQAAVTDLRYEACSFLQAACGSSEALAAVIVDTAASCAFAVLDRTAAAKAAVNAALAQVTQCALAAPASTLPFLSFCLEQMCAAVAANKAASLLLGGCGGSGQWADTEAALQALGPILNTKDTLVVLQQRLGNSTIAEQLQKFVLLDDARDVLTARNELAQCLAAAGSADVAGAAMSAASFTAPLRFVAYHRDTMPFAMPLFNATPVRVAAVRGVGKFASTLIEPEEDSDDDEADPTADINPQAMAQAAQTFEKAVSDINVAVGGVRLLATVALGKETNKAVTIRALARLRAYVLHAHNVVEDHSQRTEAKEEALHAALVGDFAAEGRASHAQESQRYLQHYAQVAQVAQSAGLPGVAPPIGSLYTLEAFLPSEHIREPIYTAFLKKCAPQNNAASAALDAPVPFQLRARTSALNLVGILGNVENTVEEETQLLRQALVSLSVLTGLSHGALQSSAAAMSVPVTSDAVAAAWAALHTNALPLPQFAALFAQEQQQAGLKTTPSVATLHKQLAGLATMQRLSCASSLDYLRHLLLSAAPPSANASSGPLLFSPTTVSSPALHKNAQDLFMAGGAAKGLLAAWSELDPTLSPAVAYESSAIAQALAELFRALGPDGALPFAQFAAQTCGKVMGAVLSGSQNGGPSAAGLAGDEMALSSALDLVSLMCDVLRPADTMRCLLMGSVLEAAVRLATFRIDQQQGQAQRATADLEDLSGDGVEQERSAFSLIGDFAATAFRLFQLQSDQAAAAAQALEPYCVKVLSACVRHVRNFDNKHRLIAHQNALWCAAQWIAAVPPAVCQQAFASPEAGGAANMARVCFYFMASSEVIGSALEAEGFQQNCALVCTNLAVACPVEFAQVFLADGDAEEAAFNLTSLCTAITRMEDNEERATSLLRLSTIATLTPTPRIPHDASPAAQEATKAMQQLFMQLPHVSLMLANACVPFAEIVGGLNEAFEGAHQARGADGALLRDTLKAWLGVAQFVAASPHAAQIVQEAQLTKPKTRRKFSEAFGVALPKK